MALYRVNVADVTSEWTDLVDMSKAEADALRTEGEAMVELEGDLQHFQVEMADVFTLDTWRSAYGDLIKRSPGDGDPL